MKLDEVRARQLSVAISAVEDGMLDGLTALRAISQWVSSATDNLCDVLLIQPELTDASKQSLRARFEEASRDSNGLPGPTNQATVDDDALRRLQMFLKDPDTSQDGTAAEDFSLQTAPVPAAVDATDIYIPGSAPPGSSRPKAELDHFKVLREYTQGGLGILYLAQDKRLQREVILKKIKPQYAQSGDLREKFVVEAEVTGQLEHPGIVPIYALGVDGQREPYYAMRLIGGKNLHATIREFHASRGDSERFFDGLEFRELLQRFIDICQAIEYAHSRGVIHRDLKPANIMLGDHGETLVIDWGLAKVMRRNPQSTDPQSTDPASLAHTPPYSSPVPVRTSEPQDRSIPGAFGGTPRYAPPEQLAGKIELMGPACDVYSLGAILFEILCDEPALAGEVKKAKQALAKLEAGELRAPREVKPYIPRPLNAICVKAMAIEIPDRYTSARELANDVQRWLADECVLAYRDQETQLEKWARWFRHHRGWAAGIFLSSLALTVSAVAANYFINEARLKEQTAKRQATEFKQDAVSRYRVAKSAIDTLMERSEKLTDIQGTEAIRLQLLQEATAKFQELSLTESLDPDLEIERARSMVRLADARMLLQQPKQAFDQYAQVIAMLTPSTNTKLPTERLDSMELLRRIELARTYSRRALASANVLDVDAARRDYRTAIDLFAALQLHHADSVPVAGNLAIAQLNLASIEAEVGQVQTAMQLAYECLKQYQLAQVDTDPLFALNLVRTHRLLERLNRQTDKREAALKHYVLADESLSRLLTQSPDNPQFVEERAALAISAASAAREQGDYLGAIDALNKAMVISNQLLEKWPASTNYVHGKAIAALDLALVYADLNEFAKGQEHLQTAFLLFESLQGSLERDEVTLRRALTLDTAGLYLASGRVGEAPDLKVTNHFLDALDLIEPLVATAPGSRINLPVALAKARIQSHLAKCCGDLGKTVDAQTNFDNALQLLESVVTQEASSAAQRQLAHTLWHLAMLEHAEQQSEAAIAHFRRAGELWQAVLQSAPSPLHRYELAHFYVHCPVDELRNQRHGLELVENCLRSLPDNPVFTKLRDVALRPEQARNGVN